MPDGTIQTLIEHIAVVASAVSDPVTLYRCEGDDFRHLWVDPRALTEGGFDDDPLTGRRMGEVFSPEIVDRFRAEAAEALAIDEVVRYDSSIMLPSGLRHLEVTIRPMRGTSGACYLLAGARDIAGRVQLAAQRDREARRLDKLMAFAPDVIWMIEADATITFATPAVRNILGFEPDELAGVDLMKLLHTSADHAQAAAVFASVLADPGTPHEVDLWLGHEDGSRVRAECIVTNRLDDPDLRAIIVNARDITERHETQARLAHLAVHDDLTGLPNRRHLEVSLDELLVTRSDPTTIAALFIDIDGFKEVNDNLGHHAGDLVLREAADRLLDAIGPHGFVSRFGGDEYVVVSTSAAAPDDHLLVARRIQEEMTRPFEIVGATFFLSVSIGIAEGSTRDGHDAGAMLSAADLAMYRAKLRGRNNIVVFDDSMRAETAHRLSTANELRQAVEDRQLELHYQPIIDLVSGELAGCEALVRWNHPTRGLVPPNDFIPIAEQTGLIIPLGAMVVDEACAQIARWNRAGHRIRVSVNVSPLQLVDPAFADEVLTCVSRHGIDPASLAVEITEEAIMHERDVAREVLDTLDRHGIVCAIDDFGTGYSSLAQLKRLPVRSLKIDRAFVDGLGEDRESTILTHAIVAMAHALDLDIVAEGVERDDQVRRLRVLGCQLAQGYHFARAEPADEFSRRLDGTVERTLR